MTPEEVAAVMAEHAPDSTREMCGRCSRSRSDDVDWPCEPYRLAEFAQQQTEALAAERVRADAAEASHQHASRHGWDLGFKAGWSEHDERNHVGDTASRWWEGETVNPFA